MKRKLYNLYINYEMSIQELLDIIKEKSLDDDNIVLLNTTFIPNEIIAKLMLTFNNKINFINQNNDLIEKITPSLLHSYKYCIISDIKDNYKLRDFYSITELNDNNTVKWGE